MKESEVSRIEVDDHSNHDNVSVSGSNNNVVVNSKNTTITDKEGRTQTHWLQILYWFVGIIGVAFAIYFGIVK